MDQCGPSWIIVDQCGPCRFPVLIGKLRTLLHVAWIRFWVYELDAVVWWWDVCVCACRCVYVFAYVCVWSYILLPVRRWLLLSPQCQALLSPVLTSNFKVDVKSGPCRGSTRTLSHTHNNTPFRCYMSSALDFTYLQTEYLLTCCPRIQLPEQKKRSDLFWY